MARLCLASVWQGWESPCSSSTGQGWGQGGRSTAEALCPWTDYMVRTSLSSSQREGLALLAHCPWQARHSALQARAGPQWWLAGRGDVPTQDMPHASELGLRSSAGMEEASCCRREAARAKDGAFLSQLAWCQLRPRF